MPAGHLNATALAPVNCRTRGLDDSSRIEGATGQEIEQAQHQVEDAELCDRTSPARGRHWDRMGCPSRRGPEASNQGWTKGGRPAPPLAGLTGPLLHPLHRWATPREARQGCGSDLWRRRPCHKGMASRGAATGHQPASEWSRPSARRALLDRRPGGEAWRRLCCSKLTVAR